MEPATDPRVATFPKKGPSRETLALADYLRQAREGELLRYEVLALALGFDARRRIGTVRRMLAREGIEIGTVRDKGFCRETAGGIVAAVGSHNRMICRAAGRNVKRARNVRSAELSDEERKRYFAESSQAAVIHKLAGTPARKRLAAAVAGRSGALTSGAAMSALGFFKGTQRRAAPAKEQMALLPPAEQSAHIGGFGEEN